MGERRRRVSFGLCLGALFWALSAAAGACGGSSTVGFGGTAGAGGFATGDSGFVGADASALGEAGIGDGPIYDVGNLGECSGEVAAEIPAADCGRCDERVAYALCDGLFFATCACTLPPGYTLVDAGLYVGEPPDAGPDGLGLDAGLDAGVDAGVDASDDAPDASGAGETGAE
jgi:hypothetical protein